MRHRRSSQKRDLRIETFRWFLLVFASVIGVKLFVLQVLDHDFYQALASGQHEMLSQLIPERGIVYMHDYKDERLVAVATNQQLASVYADPRQVDDPEKTAKEIADVFGYSEEKIVLLQTRLDQPEDPYEPIEKEVPDAMLDRLLAKELSGIHYVREAVRLYPEPSMSGHVIGFLGSDSDGKKTGKYGIEGYFNDLLQGKPGELRSERDIAGRLIAVADRSLEPALDGADIVLTIDRTIQYKACTALQESIQKHGADGGSVVVVEPSTGKILAMCGSPDFDPNPNKSSKTSEVL